MKRFFLQSFSVILVLGLVWVFQNRQSFIRHYQNRAFKEQIKEQMATVPRPMSAEKILPCGTLGNVTVSLLCDNAVPTVAAQNMLDITNRWESIWPPVEKAIRKEMLEYQHDFHEGKAIPHLTTVIPAQQWNKDSEWSITLEYKPFNGYWTVQMSGFSAVGECMADF